VKGEEPNLQHNQPLPLAFYQVLNSYLKSALLYQLLVDNGLSG
jgi:hypothetical protein